jgi:hypothetical protein
MRGESVPFIPIQVGAVALGPEHEEVLASFTKPYRYIWPERIDYDELLTPDQRKLCSMVHRAFDEIVSWDAKRGGYYSYSPNICAGRFFRKLRPDWHPDQAPLLWLSKPVARYVLSFGNGSTIFAVGAADRTMITAQGKLRPSIKVERGGLLEPMSHPLGVVSRFMSHLDVHSEPFRTRDEPPEAKPRLFLDVSAPLIPDDYDY